MPSEVVTQFQIHQVALSKSECERTEEMYAGFTSGDELIYRLGRGNEHGIAELSLSNESDDEIKICRITIDLACKIFRQSVFEAAGEDADPADVDAVCEIRTTYDTDYIVLDSVRGIEEFDPEDLNSFAEHNVPYHVWPFFREHLCSMLSKMQIEPLTIPMLLVRPEHQKTPQIDSKKIE